MNPHQSKTRRFSRKWFADRLIRRIGFAPLQPLYETLHGLALLGMNVGGATQANKYNHSGELAFLARIRRTLLKHRQEPFTVFDVGARDGGFAKVTRVIFQDRCSIHCFEPDQEEYRNLVEGYGRYPNISTYHVALGEDHQTGVETFCREHDISHIHLLKLDVKGHELTVLRGAGRLLTERRIDVIYFEFGECHVATRTFLRDFFEALNPGYRLYRVLRNGLVPLETYKPKWEIFVSRTHYAAISRQLEAGC